jgi:tight adherence protein B
MAAIAFGAAVLATGLLAASAVRAREEERVLRLVGSVTPERAERPALARLAQRTRARGWPFGPLSYAAALACAALVAGGLGWSLLGPVGAVLGAAGAPTLIEWGLARRAGRAKDRMEGQLREAVVAMASAVRAGRSVRGALVEAVDEVEEPLRRHLRTVTVRLEVGEPIEVALDNLAAAGPPDARLLVTLLGLHGRTGGDLPAMLDEVAAIIAQRTDARSTLRALTAQGRASGVVLAVLPIAFVTLLSWTGGGGLGAFYRTPLGMVLLLAGLLCDVLGFLWIRRILQPRWVG